MKKSSAYFLLIAYLLMIVGCAATTTVDEYRPTAEPVELMTNENVAILGRRDAGHYETDREFIQCVSSKMRSSEINVLSEQRFVDAIYPWFEPRTAPKKLQKTIALAYSIVAVALGSRPQCHAGGGTPIAARLLLFGD